MKVLHVSVEQGSDFLVAQGLEEPGIITQGKSLDELLANIRDAAALLLNETDIQIELIIPPAASPARRRPRAGKGPARRGWKAPV